MSTTGTIKGFAINVPSQDVKADLQALGQLLERAERTGYDGVEISIAACAVIRGGRVWADQLDRLRALLHGRRLRYTLHPPCDLNLTRNPELAATVMESCLQVAHGIGAEVLVYHSGQIALHDVAAGITGLPSDDDLQANWERETTALIRFGQRAQELGVLIAVENRDPHRWEVIALAQQGRGAADLAHYHQGMRLDLIAAQVAQVGSPNVGICLDVGHAFLAAPYCPDTDYLHAVKMAAPWVRHVHFHDNFGRLDDLCTGPLDRLVFGEADNHLPAGWGCIPLTETVRILSAAEYAGWLVLELDSPYDHLWGEGLARARAVLSGQER